MKFSSFSSFNATILDQNVKDTNIVYGGFNPAVTQVYSTHGYLDPWRPMGIQKDLNEHSPTVVIPRKLIKITISKREVKRTSISMFLVAAHVADMDSISANDIPEMRASKETIRKLLIKWFNL